MWSEKREIDPPTRLTSDLEAVKYHYKDNKMKMAWCGNHVTGLKSLRKSEK